MRAPIADFPPCQHCTDFSKNAPCVAANFGYPERCLRRHTSFVGSNVLVIIAVVIIFCIAGLFSCAQGAEYQAPDEEVWYATLKQPDNPNTNCCGWGDAYYADKTDECRPSDVPGNGGECALVAIITDTRPDERDYVRQDGSTIKITRPHRDVGSRVAIPKEKLRKHAVENPTDHNVVFVNANDFVFCWEPVGLY